MTQNREKIIVRTSILGILANVVLAGFKAIIGIFSHSIAILLDAVNNLTDALSSVITIVGTKLAGKPADRQHPFGHGRAEYLSALVISVIILYAGITSLIESVKKILEPQIPDYTSHTFIIVGAAVIVKISLGLFVKSTGKRVNSDSLVASGQDALMDSIISASTLAAAAIFIFWGISLEAWLGAIISVAIIKAGLEALGETLSKIMGERASGELSHAIKKTVASADSEIRGAFDLVLNDYGPGRHIASVHIEVPDFWTADKIDAVTRKITNDVYEKHGVLIAAVGIYSANTKDDRTSGIKEKVQKILKGHKDIIQMHGFFVNEEKKEIRFDMVVSFDADDMQASYENAASAVQAAFPEYTVHAAFDTDISD